LKSTNRLDQSNKLLLEPSGNSLLPTLFTEENKAM